MPTGLHMAPDYISNGFSLILRSVPKLTESFCISTNITPRYKLMYIR